MQQIFLLQILLLSQYVSGTIMPIIRNSSVLYRWLLPVVFGALGCCPQTGHITLSSIPYRQLENQAQKTTGGNQLYNTLQLLMMVIVVPETCRASNKICNKKTYVASSWQFISTYSLTPNDTHTHTHTHKHTYTHTYICIYIYIYTEYFKHAARSPFFPLQNAVYFIMLPFLVPVLFTF
jgi:hypothetical protein